jgi:hypothetical protein
MLRRFGRPAEYPELVRSLAKLYPVSDPKNKPIWSMYASYRDRISASAGETMPSLDELRRVQPRSRKNPRAPKDALWVAEHYRNAPPIRSYEAYCEIRNAADCGKHPEVAYYLSYGTRELKEKESKDPMAKWELDYRTARGGGRNGFQIGKKKKR